MFGNGAAYCTLTNPTVVISLSGCWAAVCALNKKREVRNYLPARRPGTSMQSDGLFWWSHVLQGVIHEGLLIFTKTELNTDSLLAATVVT